MRCVCGAKLYLSRRHWERRGFTVCDDCQVVIVYVSLAVVDPSQVEEFMSGVIKQEGEREALREGLELELRGFVEGFDRHPE